MSPPEDHRPEDHRKDGGFPWRTFAIALMLSIALAAVVDLFLRQSATEWQRQHELWVR